VVDRREGGMKDIRRDGYGYGDGYGGDGGGYGTDAWRIGGRAENKRQHKIKIHSTTTFVLS
jgi:hypothetical protein